MRCPVCQASVPEGSRVCPSCGRPVTEDDAPLAAGAILAGRYRIVRFLGRGGMGAVYQADDERLGHPVALKFLPPALARDTRRLAQFHTEVSLARQVAHPNVCRIYDVGDVDGRLFLSMEYIDGVDLAAALLERGPFPEREAVELTRQICAGLAAVHARGVLHRDLKPANIMLDVAGRARLMGFGISAAGHIDDVERIGEGAPVYMPPEILARAGITIQSDVYALGLVMYEIFTGRPLFTAKTIAELVLQQVTLVSGVPSDLSGVRPELRRAILQCLEPNPARRPASAAGVAAMLQTVLLDARATWRRIVQIAAQFAAVVLLVVGWRFFTGTIVVSVAVRLLVIGSGLALIAAELWFPLGWTVAYKGHRIGFSNNPVAGERLTIDGRLVDRGRIGANTELHGTIDTGDGAGERITATVSATFMTLSCRIVAESFAQGPI